MIISLSFIIIHLFKVIHCTWEDEEEDCHEIFETEATDDGYCCSFNSLVLNSNKSISKP